MAKIIFDVMSGEAKSIEAINAGIAFAKSNPEAELVMVGSKLEFDKISNYPSNITFIHSTDVVTMDDTNPLTYRTKPNASLSIAIAQLKKDKDLGGIVSCANTGVYIAGSFLTSKPITKKVRPGLAGILFTKTGKFKVVMDLGAVIDADAPTLEQLAIMGSIYHQILAGSTNPKVSLIQNGTEDHKGNAVSKEAFKLLSKNTKINFIGNEEPKSIFEDDSDVMVADGFVGNAVLKTFQASMSLISYNLKKSFSKNIFRKMAGLVAMPVIKETKTTIKLVEKAGGAVMLGLNHVAIKSPGSAGQEAMENALKLCNKLINEDIVNKIKKKID